jgi:hypothetical protein
MGGARNLSEAAAAVLETTILPGVFDPRRPEKIRNWLARYIGRQELFGFTINAEALKKEAPNLSTPFGMLGFLSGHNTVC